MKLYSYFRSSTSYRARIGLALKGLPYDQVGVSLTKGEQRSEAYRSLNPMGVVPSLIDGDATITQSLAILEYLDETHPEPPFLPKDAVGRARVRALAYAVACDIHPVNNLRVLNYLTGPMGLSNEQKTVWYRHWIAEGLSGVEAMVAGHPDTGRFCHGDTPTLADICLVPQILNARRFDCDLAAYPTLVRIDEACNALAAFQAARPEVQPDAV